MQDSIRIAAIDIGTVTMRLAIADVSESDIAYVAKSSDIAQLGEGLEAAGAISDAALERANVIAAAYEGLIRECSTRDNPVLKVRVFATAAARNAKNAPLLAQVLSSHGFALEVISGEEEARLSFAGIVSSACGRGILTSDVGGGSTELVLGDALRGESPKVRSAFSVGVGARVVTDRFLASDPPTPTQLAAASEWVGERLCDAAGGLAGKAERLVSCAGTVTTLVAIRDALDPYTDDAVQGATLTIEEVDGLIGRLAAMTSGERAALKGIQPQRSGVIVGGAIAQREVMRLSGLESCTVSTDGILAGALRDAWLEARGIYAGQAANARRERHGEPSIQ